MNLRFFPNSITLLNLLIGCIVVLLLIENNIEVKYVFILSVICLILDFLDGYIARKLNAKSELGLQLDSLADMVSFGLVPGVLLYNMFLDAPSSSVGSIFSSLVPFMGFVITLCSAQNFNFLWAFPFNLAVVFALMRKTPPMWTINFVKLNIILLILLFIHWPRSVT